MNVEQKTEFYILKIKVPYLNIEIYISGTFCILLIR